MNMSKAELLAPAGDFETALAAFDAGADAVYCGLSAFSARAFATNFSLDDLKNLMRVARARGRRVYVTFNTVIDEADIESAIRRLADLDEIRPSALIVQDLGIARLCRKYFPNLELHASTQLVAHNLEGVIALKELGFTRVVLARELSLDEIISIAKRCGGVELEVFVHGALCYSISGLCLFSAMEKDRSGNRGKCAYCCRLPYETEEGERTLAFSMKDLRLGEDVRRLADAGVASLKIEGRMKSAIYVASVVSHYRAILDGQSGGATIADLETVFSRRTTKLYFNHPPTRHCEERSDEAIYDSKSPIDPVSLGHLGTPIGTVKRVTRDREGRAYLRFHTARALEKHDGLQFAAPDGGKPLGLGIVEMRPAISRTSVFEVAAGTDVEILLPPADGKVITPALVDIIRPGDTVYCSMSNAVRRMFPPASFRPSDYEGTETVDLDVTLAPDRLTARAEGWDDLSVSVKGSFTPAKSPEKTLEGVRKAFSKLGETDYRLGKLTVTDPHKLFAPMSLLNDLRRDLVEKLDAVRADLKRAKIEAALADEEEGQSLGGRRILASAKEELPVRRLRVRTGQKIPKGDWAEIIVAIDAATQPEALPEAAPLRLALPVYTSEPDFHALRLAVKRFLRAGFTAWEASDLATLRLLRELGVKDLTADWTLYAFNFSAVRQLAELGVTRLTASPENNQENLAALAESGFDIEFLEQQSTPLFISLTRPSAIPDLASGLAVFSLGKLWVTTRRLPRIFIPPKNSSTRIDLSWSPI